MMGRNTQPDRGAGRPASGFPQAGLEPREVQLDDEEVRLLKRVVADGQANDLLKERVRHPAEANDLVQLTGDELLPGATLSLDRPVVGNLWSTCPRTAWDLVGSGWPGNGPSIARSPRSKRAHAFYEHSLPRL